MTAIRVQIQHLRKDKILGKVISANKVSVGKKDTDLYVALLRAVVGQQLSVKAAQTIWTRFLGLFNNGYPSAVEIIDREDDEVRAVGLSYQKVSYVKNIAKFSIENTLDYGQLRKKK